MICYILYYLLYCVVCEIFGRGGKTYTRVTQEIYIYIHLTYTTFDGMNETDLEEKKYISHIYIYIYSYEALSGNHTHTHIHYIM